MREREREREREGGGHVNSLVLLEMEDCLEALLSLLVMDVVDTFFFETVDLVGLTSCLRARESTHWATLCQSWTANMSPNVRQITLKADSTKERER